MYNGRHQADGLTTQPYAEPWPPYGQPVKAATAKPRKRRMLPWMAALAAVAVAAAVVFASLSSGSPAHDQRNVRACQQAAGNLPAAPTAASVTNLRAAAAGAQDRRLRSVISAMLYSIALPDDGTSDGATVYSAGVRTIGAICAQDGVPGIR